ncbi:inositol monophosphatase family protein [Sanyastnella coralliicola]|uniref:inositol monophosphatase family protein n=1 Tax=Sanyastnella coralliicola TaxID=3069118 RepID=UPI0027BA5705|nr:inositol monophosphatase family protein [Longitalea sp. SCSIO 12813]
MNQGFIKRISRKAVITAGKYVIDRFQRDPLSTGGMKEVSTLISLSSRDHMIQVIDDYLQIQETSGNDHFTRLKVSSGEIHLVHLDGRECFIYGQPNFSLAISFVVEGITKMSGVFNPYYKELFFAEDLTQVKRNNIVTQVNDVYSIEESFLGFSYRGEYDSNGMKRLNTLFNIMRQPVRTMIPGSDLYGLTLVANGNLGGMILATPDLDLIGPGIFLVEAGGGKVTDLQGAQVSPSSEFVVATNGKLHSALINQGAFINLSNQ